nr:hypothetical protein CFP56_24291 [Quercus suber]
MRWSDSEVAGEARRGLMFLEVNYTFRRGDEEFMAKIPVGELAELVGPGLVSCSFNISPPEDGREEEGEGSERMRDENAEGVMAFNTDVVGGLVRRLVDEEGGTWPMGLRALNTTLYTLTVAQLGEVLRKCDRVMVLNVTVEIEPGQDTKKGLLNALESCKDLEQVEIVANPSMRFFMELQNSQSGVFSKTFPSKEDMEALAGKCPRLASLKVNMLRSTSFGTVKWETKDGKWSGGVTEGQGLP